VTGHKIGRVAVEQNEAAIGAQARIERRPVAACAAGRRADQSYNSSADIADEDVVHAVEVVGGQVPSVALESDQLAVAAKTGRIPRRSGGACPPEVRVCQRNGLSVQQRAYLQTFNVKPGT